MKLITLLMLVTTCSANEPVLPQFNHQQFPFPLQFQSPQLGSFVTENHLYLPPNSQTSIPYFAQKNTNDLQYQYLPPTGTKIPSRYPPPFHMVSTTFRPNDEDEEDDEEEEDNREFGSSTGAPFDQRFNQSRNSPGPQIEIPIRPIPKTLPYFNPLERIDTKFVSQANPMASTASPSNFQTPMNRRMIQPAGFVSNQNDQMVSDQMKTGSHPGYQYLPPPQVYGSTTEPAIPILRLSNEMDLDGSYSYEALSADQTHVMQHGHVNNLGTDRAENVVEGSYSYVGDNGQTYTVHYIADGNGFRASGDHLPVAPPVPEIIQRSIEYNIAEESSPKSHHAYNYQDDEKHNNQVRTVTHHYQTPVTSAPSGKLFTGRQPEAFSHNHNGATSSQNNNLQQSASTQTPVISHYEAPKEPPRMINAPISPQITFLASQGAHNPAESISRMYSPPNDEPVFRFGNLKNKFERDLQKSSWQYQHPYPESATKTSQVRNSISRSSIDPDDVMINFGEMTPEQYSRMYHSHINPGDGLNEEHEVKQAKQHSKVQEELQTNHKQQTVLDYSKLSREFPTNFYQNQLVPTPYEYKPQAVYLPYPQNWYSNSNIDQNSEISETNNPGSQSRSIDTNAQKSSLVTKDLFVPPSQTIMSSYDVKKDLHEAKQISYPVDQTVKQHYEPSQTTSTTARNSIAVSETYNITNYEIYKSNNPTWDTKQNMEHQKYQTTQPTSTMQSNDQKSYQNSIGYDLENSQKPKSQEDLIPEESNDGKLNHPSTTTETFEDNLKNNIFLKNFLNNNNESFNIATLGSSDSWRPSSIQSHSKSIDDKKEKKEVKMIQPKMKTASDYTETSRKTVDVSQLANFVTFKNYFESNKIKPKRKQVNNPGKTQTGYDSINFPRGQIPESNKKMFKEQKPLLIGKENTYKVQKSTDFNDNYPTSKLADMDRMMGVAKIYKTLQRNSKLDSSGYGQPQLQTNLMPPAQDYTLSLHKSQPGLPPLGRAGPSMKSYLPPIFS